MTFLPSDYKEPSTAGKYVKMKEPGTYRYRILDSPMTAFTGWTTGDKPKPVRSIGNDPGFWNLAGVEPDEVRHVWILPVWNYLTSSVQVWEIGQQTIRKAIKTYADNPKWGMPTAYDIAVTRTGTGLDNTEWTVIAEPKEPMTPECAAAWDDCVAAGFDLNRLLDGGDPFSEGI